MNKNSLYFITLALLSVLPILISSYISYVLMENNQLLSNATPLETLAFFGIFSFTMALAMTPTAFIAIISGYFFSWLGLVGIIFSYIFASILGLLIGKGLQKAGIAYSPKSGSKLEKLLNNFGKDEFMLIAFARLSPALPFAMTNIALSSLQLKWKNYLLGSIVGMLPRTLIFFWAGKNASNIWAFVANPSSEGLYKLIPVALVLISTMGLFIIIKKRVQA